MHIRHEEEKGAWAHPRGRCGDLVQVRCFHLGANWPGSTRSEGYSEQQPCGIGQDGCGDDSHCQAGLKCGIRDKGQILPGLGNWFSCKGTNWDDACITCNYCFDPYFYKKAAKCDAAWFDPTEVEVWRGKKSYPDAYPTYECSHLPGAPGCEVGQGNCKQRGDCKVGLDCWRVSEKVGKGPPGLKGLEEFDSVNFCFDPNYAAKATAVYAAKSIQHVSAAPTST